MSGPASAAGGSTGGALDGHAGEPAAAPYWAAVAALVLLALAVIWVPAFVAGQDTPVHAFFARVWQSPEAWAGILETRWAPTSQLSVYLTAPFTGLGPAVTGKVARTIGTALLLLGVYLTGRANGERRPLGLLLAPAMTAGFCQSMGFDNFVLGLGIGGVTIAACLRAFGRARPADIALVALLGLLLAHAHAVAFGLTAVVAGLLALLRTAASWRERFGRAMATVAGFVPGGLFALWATGRVSTQQQANGVAEGLGVQRLAPLEQLGNLAHVSFGGFSSLDWLPVVLFGLAALLHATGSSAPAARNRWAVALVVPALLGLYAAIPFHIPGWAYAQPRVLAALVVLTAGWLAWGRFARVWLWIHAAGVGIFLVSALQGARAAGEDVAREVAALSGPGAAIAMPVVLDPGVPSTNRYVSTLQNVAHYAMWDGGALPELWVSNEAIHSVAGLPGVGAFPPRPPAFVFRSMDCALNPHCGQARVELADRIAVQGLLWPQVLLVGDRDRSFGQALEARGYEALGSARYAPRPSGVEVSVELPAEAAARTLTVRAGLPSTLGWIAAIRRPPLPVEPGRAEEVTLRPLPAGEILVEGVLEGSGGSGPRTLWSSRVVLAPGATATLRLATGHNPTPSASPEPR